MSQASAVTPLEHFKVPEEVRALFCVAHRNILRMIVPGDTRFFSIERFLDIFPVLQCFLHPEGEFVSLIIASHVWCLKVLPTLFKKITSAYLIDFLNKRKEFLSLSLSLPLSSHIHCASLIFFSVSLEKRKKSCF